MLRIQPEWARRVRRGTFGSVRALESAIRDYLTYHNQNPSPSPALPMQILS